MKQVASAMIVTGQIYAQPDHLPTPKKSCKESNDSLIGCKHIFVKVDCVWNGNPSSVHILHSKN